MAFTKRLRKVGGRQSQRSGAYRRASSPLPRVPVSDEVHDLERWLIVDRHLQDVGGNDELGAGFPGFAH